MKDFKGETNDARGRPDLYQHLAYTCLWSLVFAFNVKLKAGGFHLYPPGEYYQFLNSHGLKGELDGEPLPDFRKWGSWFGGWVYRLFGLQLPLFARKIRVSPFGEAFEIVGRYVPLVNQRI